MQFYFKSNLCNFLFLFMLAGCTSAPPVIQSRGLQVKDWIDMIDRDPSQIPDPVTRAKTIELIKGQAQENAELIKVLKPAPVPWFERWEFRAGFLAVLVVAVILVIRRVF